MSSFFSVLVTLAILAACNISRAQSLESTGDAIFGPNSITRDLNTGLEWLDVDLTTDKSFNEIALLTQPGGTFEGFEIATFDQVAQLYNSAGLSLGTTFDTDSAISFIELVGQTFSQNQFPEVAGFTSTSTGVSPVSSGQIGLVDFAPTNGVPSYVVGGGLSIGTTTTPVLGIGAWLVRPAAIPEPNVAPIAALAFLAGAIRHRRTFHI